jgi:rhodanese-related sulfurtransferase
MKPQHLNEYRRFGLFAILCIFTKGQNKMQQFLLFIGQHWMLVLLFIVILGAIIWLETQGKVSGMSRVSPQEAINMINRQSAVVFDIRDKNAFTQGHIAHSHNFSQSELSSKDLSKYQESPIILVCNTGTSAPKLGQTLKAKGLKQLYFLQGGITAWTNANLPLVKKR